MTGIKKAAKQANDRSLRCRICPYGAGRCTPAINRVCSDNFIEGFKRGVEWAKKQMKEKQK